MKKRLISLALAIVIALGIAPVPALASTGREKSPTVETSVIVNPIYRDIFTEADIAAQLSKQNLKPLQLQPQSVVYANAEEAAPMVLEAMLNRESPIVLTVLHPDNVFGEVAFDVLDLVYEHSGNPKAGDYLSHTISGMQASTSISGPTDGLYKHTVTLEPAYMTTAEQEMEMDQAVEELLTQLDLEGQAEYEKIFAVYKYMCSNITYDFDNLNDKEYKLKHTAYAALINKTAVCQGYAVLFYRLMLELGIDARYIAGDTTGGRHGWNIVRIGDLYYNVDSTWDAGNSSYFYFLRSQKNFGNHNRDPIYTTIAFQNRHPMCINDYSKDAPAIAESYIGTGYANSEQTALWFVQRDGTLELTGTGMCADYTEDTRPPFAQWYDEILNLQVREGITHLGSYSLRNFTALQTAQLPGTLGSIGAGCFSGCSALTEIYFYGDAPTIAADAFTGVTAMAYYPYDNPTWTSDVLVDYGGSLIWIAEYPSHKHEFRAVTTDPTCTEQGFTTHTCSCGEEYVNSYTNPLGHDMGVWETTKSPTDTEDGLQQRNCARCGLHEQRAVSPFDADYTAHFSEDDWRLLKLINKERQTGNRDPLTGFALLQQAADLEAEWNGTDPNGTKNACKELGLAYSAIVNMAFSGGTNAESLMAGWRSNPSLLNKYLMSDNYNSVGIGYWLDENTTQRYWTNLFRGYKGGFLSYVVALPQYDAFPEGTKFDEMDIYLVLEHSVDSFIHYLPLTQELVTIEDKGCVMTVSFDLLGLSGSFDVAIDHPHDYTAVTTAPTCTEQGYTTYTCICGDRYVGDYVAAPGHEYDGNTCKRCGEAKPVQNPFDDVPDDSFFYAPVMWAVEHSITSGTSPTIFSPSGTCLRAQVVTFLHRAAGTPEPTSENNPFDDVKAGNFFYKSVLWAVENQITSGTSASTFGSYDNCNRAAVVTFLWRAAGSPEPASTKNPFEDVKTTDFYYKPVLWAVEKGITSGLDATHFGPTTDCNRAQVVTFLYRAYN